MSQHFFLLQVIDSRKHTSEVDHSMDELRQLVETFGGTVCGQSFQHRAHPDVNMYLGPGKVDWLIEVVKELEIDVVVINDAVKSGQLFRLEKALWKVNPHIKVWDRVDMILHIFDQHATSTEAKFQIKLATITHLGPRAYGLGGNVLSRQGAGIGTRGKGETNIEIERRRSRREQQRLTREISRLENNQAEQMRQRKEKGIFTIALIGYTSAGKTTLFNSLTKKGKKTHHTLFTTLDSITGRMNPRNGNRPIIVSDTIGFIRDLPTELIQAFKSTLSESVHAHLLLEVVDVSDPRMLEKHQIVGDILKTLGASQQIITVFNKIDVLSQKELSQVKVLISKNWNNNKVILVSAKTSFGLSELRQQINRELEKVFGQQ